MSVTSIYNYFKKYGYETIVMGASFRNSGEIIELAGCDRLTISPGMFIGWFTVYCSVFNTCLNLHLYCIFIAKPALLEELTNGTDDVQQKLDAANAQAMDIPKVEMTESNFRWMMNEDAMATEKLAEGIRGFAKDIVKLEEIVQAKINASKKE